MNTCISPEEIEGWELEAYLHGDAPARVIQHVARCSACRARVNDQQGFHRRLQRALARADCPAADTLLQRRWGQLPLGRARVIDAHLASCAACRAEYAAFSGPEPGPVQQMLAAAGQRLSVLTAIFQPALAPAPVLRGAESPPAIYRVPERDWEIMLTYATGSRGHVLTGQLLGAGPEELTGAEAGILADDRLLLTTALDSTGWFALQPLPAGRYTLWLDVGALHIRAPEVVVGPQASTLA